MANFNWRLTQSKKKASGKIYTYYHCANKRCEQNGVYTEQRRLIAQFSAAFEPFQRFTPKATAAFIKMVQGRISQLSGHSTEKVNQLREKKTQLQDRMAQIHDLYEKGLLSHEEALEFQAIKERELEKIGKDIMLHGISVTQGGERSWGGVSEVQGDWRIALDLIELLKTSHDFMQLDGFEGQKARIYRSMLSNPTLKDGTIEYRYAKWFADLLLLTGGRNWWRWWELNPRP